MTARAKLLASLERYCKKLVRVDQHDSLADVLLALGFACVLDAQTSKGLAAAVARLAPLVPIDELADATHTASWAWHYRGRSVAWDVANDLADAELAKAGDEVLRSYLLRSDRFTAAAGGKEAA